MVKYPLRLDDDERGERWRVRGDQIIAGVHAEEICEGACVLHNPTNHHMREWSLLWRNDRHIFERACPHGIGHPEPDDRGAGEGIHGCDGCCVKPLPAWKVEMNAMSVALW